MAGDWIKFEKSSLRKPEVLMIARMLSIPLDQALGILIRFWCWLDDNCVDGVVDGVVDADVDALLSCPGLSALLKMIKWVEFTVNPNQLRVVNFDRHNGETSKNRALKNERQAKWRANRVDASPSTREEKRREDKNKSNTMSNSPETANLDVLTLPKNNDNRERRIAAGEILGFLNAKTSRNFRMQDQNLGPIMARMKDGATPRELRAVIVRKCREWGSDDKMAKYLRPATLFNATKFAQYVGEVPPEIEVQDGKTLS